MIPTTQSQKIQPSQVPPAMPSVEASRQSEPVRVDPRASVSVKQNFNDIMAEGKQFGSGSFVGEKKLFEEEE